MTRRAFGPEGSSTLGSAAWRVRTTMSIGFSRLVTCELTFKIPGVFSTATGVCLLMVLSVMSARAVALRCDTRGDMGDDKGLSVESDPISDGAFSVTSGSGETEGCGVGSNEGSSSAMGFVAGAIGMRLFLFARMLCLPPVVLFLGGAFLTGEAGSSGATFSDASNISDGSVDSPVLVRRARVLVRGVGGSSTVFRLVPRVVRADPGVNSSSLSLFASGVMSSSSESSMIFLRAAALLEGLVGEAANMLRFAVVRSCNSGVRWMGISVYRRKQRANVP